MEHAQWVGIGEAAALTGTTPNAIRHMHRSGLLPEPGRGPGERRRYGYEDVVRILWVRGMTELGTPAAEVRSGMEAAAAGRGDLLAELEASLERHREQAGELLSAVRRLHAAAGDLRVASSPFTSSAPAPAPAPSPSPSPAKGHPMISLHPRLQAEQRRLELEIEVLSDPQFPPDDPRVVALAHDFSVHLLALEAAERAADFPEADFIDTPPTPTAPPPAVLPLPPAMSPALSRLAHLLTPHPNPD